MESKREKENAGQKRVVIGKLLNIAYHLLKYKDDSCISIRKAWNKALIRISIRKAWNKALIRFQ